MKDKHKSFHGHLMPIIVILLSLILLVLIFKVGVMVGGTKSHSFFGGWHKNKTSYGDFEAAAKAKGMTVTEYKALLMEQKSK